MLIKKTLAEKWYSTDSWVYKNFAFIFQNSLWNKKVPQGYSLCPYFWMSLFALFILRPVVAVLSGLNFILSNTFGKLFRVVDDFNCRVMSGVVNGKYNRDEDYIPVLGTLSVASILFGVAMLSCLVININLNTSHSFIPQYFRYSLDIGLWLVVSLIMCNFHQKYQGIRRSERTNIEMIFGKSALVWAIITGIVMVASCWKPIGEFFVWLGKSIAVEGWLLIKWAGLAIWSGLTWHDPFTNIPISLIVIVVGGLAWFSSYIAVKWAEYEYNNLSPSARKQLMADKWLDMITCLYTYETSGHIKDKLYASCDVYVNHAVNQLSHAILKDTVYKTYKSVFSKTTLSAPRYPSKDIYKSGYFEQMWFIREQLDSKDAVKFNLLEEKFLDNLVLVMKKYKSDINSLAAVLKKQDDDLLKHKVDYTDNAIYRLISKWNAKIKSLTLDGIEQAGIFFSYMWMLVKAKKQKACPYFMFTTPTKPKK